MIDQESQNMWKTKKKFLSYAVYYFGDLLKSANMAFTQHKTFISL